MPQRPEDLERMAAVGLLATSTAEGLAEPLAQVKAALAEACDLIDRHIGTSRGPDPLPRAQTSKVRETIADAFMAVSRCARLAGDLAAVVGAESVAQAPIDVNDAVQRAVALAGARVAEECDLRLDLGFVPTVKGNAAQLAQAIAYLLLDAAEAVRPAGGSITVRTVEDDGAVVVDITRTPPGETHALFASLVESAVAAHEGTLSTGPMGEAGDRVRVELRLPAR
jgi:C4-dicarboxylate-specific signal transduction histidine kinase